MAPALASLVLIYSLKIGLNSVLPSSSAAHPAPCILAFMLIEHTRCVSNTKVISLILTIFVFRSLANSHINKAKAI